LIIIWSINALCGQNADLLLFKSVVFTVITGFKCFVRNQLNNKINRIWDSVQDYKRRESVTLSVSWLSRSSTVRRLFTVNCRTSKRPWTKVSSYWLHRGQHTVKSTLTSACPNRWVRNLVQYGTKHSVNRTTYIIRDSS